MKKRFLPLILAFVVLIGGIGVRPQRAYASAVLVGESVDVLWGLLAGAGVIVGHGETFEKRQEDIIQFFDDLPSTQKTAFWEWYQSGTWATADTGHKVFYPSVDVDKSWYIDFFDSVYSTFNQYLAFSFTPAGVTGFSYDSTAYDMTAISKIPASLNPVVARFWDNNSYLCATLLPSGWYVVWEKKTSGVINVIHKSYAGLDASMDFSYRMFQDDPTGMRFIATITDSVPDFDSWGLLGNLHFNDYSGFVFGTPDSLYGLGFSSPSALSFATGAVLGLDTAIPADSYADVIAGNRSFGIVTGRDFSGVNDITDAYNPEVGVITGVDAPVIDVPVTGDLTGIAGGIKSILDWLKGLIKALGDLLTSLFVPTDAALKGAFEPIMVGLKDKMDLETFENFKNQMQSLSSPPAPNITLDLHGTTYTVIDFTSFNSVRDKLFGWIRGYLFVFILLFNMNFVYKLIRGQSMFDGMGTSLIFGFGSDGNSGGSGKRGRDK